MNTQYRFIEFKDKEQNKKSILGVFVERGEEKAIKVFNEESPSFSIEMNMAIRELNTLIDSGFFMILDIEPQERLSLSKYSECDSTPEQHIREVAFELYTIFVGKQEYGLTWGYLPAEPYKLYGQIHVEYFSLNRNRLAEIDAAIMEVFSLAVPGLFCDQGSQIEKPFSFTPKIYMRRREIWLYSEYYFDMQDLYVILKKQDKEINSILKKNEILRVEVDIRSVNQYYLKLELNHQGNNLLFKNLGRLP